MILNFYKKKYISDEHTHLCFIRNLSLKKKHCKKFRPVNQHVKSGYSKLRTGKNKSINCQNEKRPSQYSNVSADTSCILNNFNNNFYSKPPLEITKHKCGFAECYTTKKNMESFSSTGLSDRRFRDVILLNLTELILL